MVGPLWRVQQLGFSERLRYILYMRYTNYVAKENSDHRTTREDNTMISYRYQYKGRGLNCLLNPRLQRSDVSAYTSLSDLAAYVAVEPVKRPHSGVCVLEGAQIEGEALYSNRGEVLVLPTSASWLDPVLEEKFFAAVDVLFDLYWLEDWTWDQLREHAQELLPR